MIQLGDLKKYDFFTDLHMGDIELLAKIGEARHALEGEAILRIGLPAHTLYILEEGNLMVAFEDGRAITLHEQGKVVGWSALIRPFKYRASVICLTDCTLVAFPANELLRLIQSNAEIGTRITNKISEVLNRRLPFISEKDRSEMECRS